MHVKDVMLRCARYKNPHIAKFKDIHDAVDLASMRQKEHEKQMQVLVNNGASREVARCVVKMSAYQPTWMKNNQSCNLGVN